MDISTYQEKSFETAMYPEKGSGSILALTYVGLGMGESGEVQLKLKERLSQNSIFSDLSEISNSSVGELISELGDYFWYGAGLATELSINLADEISEFSDFLSSGAELNLKLSGLGLGISGLVQNELKKIIRDDNGIVTEERLLKLTHLIVLYIEAGYELCKSLGINPLLVFESNVAKLSSRKERGVIQGSGDSR